MLRDSAVSLLAKRLGNRTDLDSYIVSEMQFVQELLENDAYLPSFLLSEIASTSTAIDEERIVLPSDFLREYEQGALWYYDTLTTNTWNLLTKRPLEELKGAFTDQNYPQYYALADNYFRIAPIPDAVYNLKMLYYKRDTALDTNIENNWLKYAPGLMMAMTGLQVATYIQNDRMMQIFGALVPIEETKFRNADEARRHANMNYYMGFK